MGRKKKLLLQQLMDRVISKAIPKSITYSSDIIVRARKTSFFQKAKINALLKAF